MNNSLKYNDYDLQNLENGIKDELKEIMNPNLSLLEFVNIWLDLFKKNSIKSASYNRLLTSRDALIKYDIAKKNICDITFFDIQRYINELVDHGYSSSNIKKQVLIVTAPLKQAAAMKVIPADPCVGTRMPTETNIKKKTKEVIAYTDKEQEQIWNIIQKEPDNVCYLAVAFQMETGLRAGELLALKWSDVNINLCKMHVHATIINPQYKTAEYQDSPKSKSSNRKIPLTPKAIAILKRLRDKRKTEWVFEKYQARLTYQQLTYQTKKLCKLAKVKYLGEHVFRHTFATKCYYKGIDVKILSRLLGHSSVQITYNIYINLYGDGFDDMYAALCF